MRLGASEVVEGDGVATFGGEGGQMMITDDYRGFVYLEGGV
jgi:hypothetical protein